MPSSAALFAALGDETRLRLVARLCADGPASISRLALGASVSRQAITKHLQMMEAAGLTRSSKHGRECIWELDVVSIEEARRHLAQISRQWDDALGRLRRSVEQG